MDVRVDAAGGNDTAFACDYFGGGANHHRVLLAGRCVSERGANPALDAFPA